MTVSRLLHVIVVAGVAIALGACRAEPPPPPAAAPAPVPEPSPIELPPPPPVTGEAVVTILPVSNGPILFGPSDPNHEVPPTDETAVDDFVDAVVAWLDDHLTDLQGGGDGRLADVAMDGLVERAPATTATLLTTALTFPDRHVAAATYDILVAVDGAPQWIHITVRTAWPDGMGIEAALVFVPGDEGPSLVAGGPAREAGP